MMANFVPQEKGLDNLKMFVLITVYLMFFYDWLWLLDETFCVYHSTPRLEGIGFEPTLPTFSFKNNS